MKKASNVTTKLLKELKRLNDLFNKRVLSKGFTQHCSKIFRMITELVGNYNKDPVEPDSDVKISILIEIVLKLIAILEMLKKRK